MCKRERERVCVCVCYTNLLNKQVNKTSNEIMIECYLHFSHILLILILLFNKLLMIILFKIALNENKKLYENNKNNRIKNIYID